MPEQSIHLPYLGEMMVFLVTAGIVVPLLRYFRMTPLLGFLVAGLVVGPHGLGRFAQEYEPLKHLVIFNVEGVRHLAEFGVIFLLFTNGLELSFNRLWQLRRYVFGLGAMQVIACALPIGIVAHIFGNGIYASVVLGLALSLSSTAIIMQILRERHEVASSLGRTTFSVALFQDMALFPILFLVGMYTLKDAGGDLASEAALAIGKALGAAIVLIVLGRLLLRPLFRMVAAMHSEEAFMAAALLIIVGTAAIAGQVGLSMALGAFLAGLLLAETEYNHQIELVIAPFRGLLLGLFFLSVGMGIDMKEVVEKAQWLVPSVVGLYLIKSTIVFGLCRLLGLSRGRSLAIALLLGQAGEFAFVIIGMANGVGIVPANVAQFMLVVTGLSMLITPLVNVAGQRVLHRWRKKARRNRMTAEGGEAQMPRPHTQEGHVIMVGYGDMGHVIAGFFLREHVSCTVIDVKSKLPRATESSTVQFLSGDALNPELWQKAGIAEAALVILALPHSAMQEQVLRLVRSMRKDVPVHARAPDARHAGRLMKLGASMAVPENLEASLHMAHEALKTIGLPDEVVRDSILVKRHLEITDESAREKGLAT